MQSSRGFLGFLLSPKAGAVLLVIVLAAYLIYYFMGGAACWAPGVIN
ncbi:MAG TPA: hypothetical protein VM779_13485 [Thermoanaerobaculia bacterium]|nr:hypothetical protein [Thermoanaerobaculia bacterium]